MRLSALTVLAGPFFGYPVYLGVLVSVDTLVGERLFEYHARFEQRLLLDTFLADYVASLPLAFALMAVLTVLALIVRRRSGAGAAAAALLLGGAAVGAASAFLLTGRVVGGAALTLCLAGACYGALLAALTRAWFRQASHTEAQ